MTRTCHTVTATGSEPQADSEHLGRAVQVKFYLNLKVKLFVTGSEFASYELSRRP